MPNPTREEIFANASRLLRSEFENLSTIPHNQIKGQEAEGLVRNFLRQRLPRRFDVGAGFIIDPKNRISKQTDIVIYDALNCPVYSASESAGIYPSDNVAAVIEIKSQLTAAEIVDGFEKIRSVKSLSKTAQRAPPIPPQMMPYERVQTLGCIFAFRSTMSLDAISQVYAQQIAKHGLGHHADIVVVLDFCTVTLAGSLPGGPGWGTLIFDGLPPIEGAHLAISARPLGNATLDAFIRLLLANLVAFRHIVPHPGFLQDNEGGGRDTMMTYVMSTTTEKDPVKRAARLEAYRKQIEADFGSRSVPNDLAKFRQK